MYPAIGAYIQAFGPDLAGGAAAAFFTFNKLRLHPAGRSRTSIAADFQLELRSCWLTGNSFSMAFIPNTL